MSLQLNDVCNVQTFLTKVSYGNAVKSLILYPGITLKEVHDTLMGQINNILLYILGVTNYMLKFGGKD